MSQIEIIKIKLLNQNLQNSQLLFHKKIINPVDSEFWFSRLTRDQDFEHWL